MGKVCIRLSIRHRPGVVVAIYRYGRVRQKIAVTLEMTKPDGEQSPSGAVRIYDRQINPFVFMTTLNTRHGSGAYTWYD